MDKEKITKPKRKYTRRKKPDEIDKIAELENKIAALTALLEKQVESKKEEQQEQEQEEEIQISTRTGLPIKKRTKNIGDDKIRVGNETKPQKQQSEKPKRYARAESVLTGPRQNLFFTQFDTKKLCATDKKIDKKLRNSSNEQ